MLHLRSRANSATMSTLTVHCHWGDEMARERTGHQHYYAEATKMKALTLIPTTVIGLSSGTALLLLSIVIVV